MSGLCQHGSGLASQLSGFGTGTSQHPLRLSCHSTFYQGGTQTESLHQTSASQPRTSQVPELQVYLLSNPDPGALFQQQQDQTKTGRNVETEVLQDGVFARPQFCQPYGKDGLEQASTKNAQMGGGVAEELNIYMDLRHFPHRLLRQEEGKQKLHGRERRQLPDWITEVSTANEEQVATSCGLQMWHSIWAHTI